MEAYSEKLFILSQLVCQSDLFILIGVFVILSANRRPVRWDVS